MTHPTDEELDALVRELRVDSPVCEEHFTANKAAAALTALRAQLADEHRFKERIIVEASDAIEAIGKRCDEAHARADRAEAELAALSDPLVVDMNMLNGRIAKPCVDGIVHIYAGQLVSVDQLQAECAAQIEVDAGIAWQMREAWMCAAGFEGFATAAKNIMDAIRNQPHDRTALDRIIADTQAKARRAAGAVAYRICAETRHVTLGQKVEDAILAVIPKEGA